jgi:predicted transcriptional regulator
MAKKELFDKTLQEQAAYFKAFAHPARIAIINYLIASESCICGDISNELPLSRTTINQHLKELKDIGIIQGEVSGKERKYCLNQDVVSNIRCVLKTYLDSIKCKNNQCNI